MKYYLAEACQNTFILLDCLEYTQADTHILQAVHHHLIAENRDDALILIDGNETGDAFTARMLVLGQDGTLGEFCGNGSRACAAFLFAHYSHAQSLFLLSSKGKHPLIQQGEAIYSIQLPPVSFVPNAKFVPHPEQLPKELIYAEAIEPHLILQGSMSDAELRAIGRQWNQRKDLFPLGINVNACEVIEEGVLFVKTFERGVQNLTKSCGTGSLSCAAFYCIQGIVQVHTPGGALTIGLNPDSIVLQGPAHVWEKGCAA